MQKHYSVPIGKTVRNLAKLRGGGSALPGLVIEKIDPDFVRRSLDQLPHGVIIISGSNGKTTTTKMVVELLESQGLRVFTNRTGSNFSRGVAAALLGDIDTKGRLDADIAVLELDEAHGVHFVETIKPNFVLLLNVMRDQLDRFGEIDTIAKFVTAIARSATDGVVVNRDDPRLKAITADAPIHTFGTAPALQRLFPSDDDLHEPAPSAKKTFGAQPNDVSLVSLEGQKAVIAYDAKQVEVSLKINGIYNVLNAVAAFALCRMVLGKNADDRLMIERLQSITPAFGRGETFTINGEPLEVILVKNPAGFRLSLASFPIAGHKTMIAINDNYADGRDMSWLWDIDFTSLQPSGVSMLSGVRAYDMALRLQYDDVHINEITIPLKKAVQQFIKAHPDSPKRIFCTYTAMLAIRQELSKLTHVEAVL